MTEPGLRTAAALTHLSTMLYDVIAVLQMVVEPDKGNLVVLIIMHWLRSRHLSCV
jgi:hypothetical protein